MSPEGESTTRDISRGVVAIYKDYLGRGPTTLIPSSPRHRSSRQSRDRLPRLSIRSSLRARRNSCATYVATSRTRCGGTSPPWLRLPPGESPRPSSAITTRFPTSLLRWSSSRLGRRLRPFWASRVSHKQGWEALASQVSSPRIGSLWQTPRPASGAVGRGRVAGDGRGPSPHGLARDTE